MTKKSTENYLDYKKRVIDPISSSFCAAKWNNATIWLGSGTTASCHHPPAHKIDAEEVKLNPAALHNTKHKKLMRKQMLCGERPSECEYCWKIEDIGRDNISDRVFKTVIYDDDNIQEISKLPWDTDVPLKTMEIAFDRTCNFACSYCNASFSTTWARDIRQGGPYQNLVSDGAAAFEQDGSWAQPYNSEEENPYIQAFWEWWPEISQTLTEIRITGGEPLMAPSVWKLFDWFEENPDTQMQFAVNSNLGAKPELIDKLIEKSQHIKDLHIYTSCEAFGEQAEYIRDGLDYEYWYNNVRRLITETQAKIHIMMTLNGLCLFSITKLMDDIIKIREETGTFQGSMSFNLVRFPSFMSPLALPDHIKDDRRTHLEGWLAFNEDSRWLSEFEIEGIKRTIDYLETVDAPHRRVSGKESMWRDFRTFYEQYDYRRGKNIRGTFPPILVDWFDSIPLTSLPKSTKLKDGDSTKGWHNDAELKELAEKEGWELNPKNENPR